MKKFACIIISATLLSSCLNRPEPEDNFIREISYSELCTMIENMDETKENFWVNIIDVGSKSTYLEGFIEYAFNIDLNDPRHINGYPLTFPEAVELFVDESRMIVVYSSSNNDEVYTAARAIYDMKYPKVYFYEKGLEDWRANNGYLCIGPDGFMAWYDSVYQSPGDSLFLLDLNPHDIYEGSTVDAGHIPYAYFLPLESFLDTSGGDIAVLNNGEVLTNIIHDSSSCLYVYSDSSFSERVSLFIEGARELGYGNITWFKDGRCMWQESGRELE